MAQAKKTTKKTKTEEKAQLEEILKADESIVESEAEEVVKEAAQEEKPAKTTAKAGKRSAKSVAEAEAKQEKQAKKTEMPSAGDKKPKQAANPPREREERAGKKYREAAKLIDKSKVYSLNEAVELATKTAITKFDSSVELHVNLNVDPKQADQNVRDNVVLPAGTGKTLKVAVLAETDKAAVAKKAGADLTDAERIFGELDKQKIDFDVLIAEPAMMAKLGKYARLLGPRGLMPNPKSGTVAADVGAAVTEAKAGKVEYRVDQAGIIHLALGKVSFGPAKLAQNAEAVLSSIRAAKPASVKGIYVKSAYLTTSMGPSIKLEV